MLPLAWPLPPFTPEQIEEARDCDVLNLQEERYPAGEGLFEGHLPESACDWAVLTDAYANSLPEDTPPDDTLLSLLGQTISLNPAFLLQDEIIYTYIGSVTVVEAPPARRRKRLRSSLLP